MNTAKCRSCGADILFLRNKKTLRFMCLDKEYVEDGNVLCTDTNCEVLPKDRAEAITKTGQWLRKSHHATCPNAAQHRKQK